MTYTLQNSCYIYNRSQALLFLPLTSCCWVVGNALSYPDDLSLFVFSADRWAADLLIAATCSLNFHPCSPTPVWRLPGSTRQYLIGERGHKCCRGLGKMQLQLFCLSSTLCCRALVVNLRQPFMRCLAPGPWRQMHTWEPLLLLLLLNAELCVLAHVDLLELPGLK